MIMPVEGGIIFPGLKDTFKLTSREQWLRMNKADGFEMLTRVMSVGLDHGNIAFIQSSKSAERELFIITSRRHRALEKA